MIRSHVLHPGPAPPSSFRHSSSPRSTLSVRASAANQDNHAVICPTLSPRSRLSVRASAANQDDHVVIVGGGVGGLSAAAYLSRSGIRCTVLERGSTVGGRLQTTTTPLGYRFDTGPSLLLFPFVYRDTWKELGRDLSSLPVRQIPVAGYRVFISSGTSLDLLYDASDMAAQLERLEPGAGQAYRRWFKDAVAALDIGYKNFITKDEDDLTNMVPPVFELASIVQRINPVSLLRPHSSLLSDYFKDARIRAALSFQNLYVGLSPFNAPGAYNLLPATEIKDGVYYPYGGWAQISASLGEIAREAGTTIRLATEVEAIELSVSDSKPRVSSVRLSSGERIACSTVIANRDLPAVYEILSAVGTGAAARSGAAGGEAGARATQPSAVEAARGRLEGMDYSCSVIAYYWSVNKKLPSLLHHNVFLSDEYEASWQRVKEPNSFLDAPNFYVHCPSRSDPTAAPEGGESVMVLLPVANLQERGQLTGPGRTTEEAAAAYRASLASLVAEGRRRVLRTMSRAGADFGDNIVEESVRTPSDWAEEYGIKHGSVFGLAHGLTQLASLRPSPKAPEAEGLFFAGASTRPGNGVPLALISGRMAAERVLRERGRTLGNA